MISKASDVAMRLDLGLDAARIELQADAVRRRARDLEHFVELENR